MHKLDFFPKWHCSLKLLINVISEWYLLRIMVFLAMRWSAENIEKKKKQTEENIEKRREKRRIWGKSNNHNIHIFDFKLYFARKHNLKKVVFTIKLYLQFLCVAGYLKHSNDTPNLNIHKYTNYDIIEMYINRLSTTTQIFIAMDVRNDVRYLIMMSEKYLYFRKKTNIRKDIFYSPHTSNWVHVLGPCTHPIRLWFIFFEER